jgi:hypothetical protein
VLSVGDDRVRSLLSNGCRSRSTAGNATSRGRAGSPPRAELEAGRRVEKHSNGMPESIGTILSVRKPQWYGKPLKRSTAKTGRGSQRCTEIAENGLDHRNEKSGDAVVDVAARLNRLGLKQYARETPGR